MLNPAIGLLFECLLTLALFTASIFFMTLSNFIGVLPTLLPYVSRSAWRFLAFSCELYFVLLNPLALVIQRYWQRNLLTGLLRVATTTVMSLLLGCAALRMLRLPLDGCPLILFGLHGLAVGLLWDQMPNADDHLQMGE